VDSVLEKKMKATVGDWQNLRLLRRLTELMLD